MQLKSRIQSKSAKITSQRRKFLRHRCIALTKPLIKIHSKDMDSLKQGTSLKMPIDYKQIVVEYYHSLDVFGSCIPEVSKVMWF